MRRMTVLPWIVWASIIGVVLGFAFFSNKAFGQEYEASGDGVRVLLFHEKCQLDAVSNLPGRALWVEKEKTVEGCFGVDQKQQIVTFYFADKTIVVLQMQLFRKLVSA